MAVETNVLGAWPPLPPPAEMPDGRYATVADVQARLDAPADVDAVSIALAKADLISEARAGRSFDDSATERVVEDVRGDLVGLLGSLTDVTAVEVDGYELSSNAYTR